MNIIESEWGIAYKWMWSVQRSYKHGANYTNLSMQCAAQDRTCQALALFPEASAAGQLSHRWQPASEVHNAVPCI